MERHWYKFFLTKDVKFGSTHWPELYPLTGQKCISKYFITTFHYKQSNGLCLKNILQLLQVGRQATLKSTTGAIQLHQWSECGDSDIIIKS